MNNSTADFTIAVQGVKGICPAGEKWAQQKMTDKRTPVLSCEGPCIRGEIARLAANFIAREEPYARSCYAEVALVPHSSMAQWVKAAEKVIMIDGCFLKCIGRVLGNLVAEEKIIYLDALSLYKKYTDIFSMEDVPEAERKEIAQQVAAKILVLLRES